MTLDFAVEKAFKIGLYVSTLAMLGAPTMAMMQTAFMTSEAVTFQDAVVNEIQLVYAGKLQSVNSNILLPKNTTVDMFDSLGSADYITIDVTTPLGSSGPMKKDFPTTVHQNGGVIPTVSSTDVQCFTMTTARDQATAQIFVTFTPNIPCGSSPEAI